MHPWHGIEAVDGEIIPALIEIPAGSKTKFEIHKPTGLLKVDRMLYGSVHYPTNYGFIPRSYADDGDPLDILVLGQAVVPPLSIMFARPIGCMRMIDSGKLDDKVIAVHADDPQFNHFRSLSEISPQVMKEIENFFNIYKGLEGKKIQTNGYVGLDETRQIIRDAFALYKKHEVELKRGVAL
ncbi:MAG: inorganic diphosphatase [Bdellovibrionota bacterium]